MVLILRSGDYLYIGNVGDSRCYLQRDLDLWQVSEDHSLVYEQLREGLLKESELEQAEGKNIITRSVGFERDVVCDIFEREIMAGDKFVLCSDGLSGMISDNRINEICLSAKPADWPDRMIKEANDAGGDDNVTVVAVEVTE
jgi:protein phosphatase